MVARATSPLRHAGARVLVMDDEPTVREIAGIILRRLGFDVAQASEGEAAAFAYADALDQQRPFDVVLLDLTVRGGLGGAAALELMGAEHPEVRAIVTSGYSNDPIMASPEQHGFVAVLPKPLTAKELTEVVLGVLDAAG
jgi:two-component system, cell cycle sensor histidine kinase and response regulator CckA